MFAKRVIALRQIAYIELMGFYAGVQRDGETPVAVVREKRLFDVDELAAAAGVKPGQTVRQGRLSCPGLAVVPYDEAHYRLPARRHLDLYARHTPGVDPEEYHRCFLDLSGPVPAGEELESIVAEVVPGYAWGAAAGLASSRFLARAAAGSAGPGKVMVVPPGREAGFLEDLPVACLWPISEELRQRLSLLGLKTVGQVRMVPVAEATRRFGKEGRLLVALSRGEDPTPVRARYPEEAVESSFRLEGEVEVGGGLLLALDTLATGLARGLAGRMAGSRKLELTLEHGDDRHTLLERELVRPRFSRKSLLEQLMGLVSRAGPVPAVTGLRAVAGSLVRVPAEQLSLIATREEEDDEKWARLGGTLESLSRKYRGTVVEFGSRRPPDRREAMLDWYDPMRSGRKLEGE
ncbi:MAG: DNA polymerase Y family protein [Bacillota bacterium]